MPRLETYRGGWITVTVRDIKKMNREELIDHLESRGVACYSYESTSELRETALQDLEC